MRTNNAPHSENPAFKRPGWLTAACVAGIVVGSASLAVGFAVAPLDAWLWLLVNFLIFSGAATAMLAWAAGFRVAQARWAAAVNRLGHAGIAFVPVAAIALIALVAGVARYSPWVAHPVPEKGAWLNVPFFVAREIVGLGVLWGLGYLLVRWTLRADAQIQDGQQITERQHYRLNSLSVVTVMVYAVVVTIVSYDFIMALSPMWVSTMFGPYYFCTNLYLALAVLIIMAALLRKPLGAEQYLKPQQFHDLGNLMLAFSLLNMGFFFAQYLTIWYENLPDETFFLIIRYLRGPWPPIGWTALIIGYAIPFIVLQSRTVKTNPRLLWPVALLAVIGVALERYVLVVPSLYRAKLMLYPVSALSILVFLGAFVLVVTAFLSRYPAISTADEALRAVREAETV